MEHAKSIDELYREVKDYDLVITNDAALASALNARIDRPIVGFFALTPKQIAGMQAMNVIGEPIWRDLKIISTISEEQDLDFKYVHGELENIKFIRTFTKDVRSQLHTKTARRVYDSFEALPTQIRVMSSFDPYTSDFLNDRPRIALIAPDLFNDLDKSFNGNFDIIEPFDNGDYEIDTIYEIGNDRQLAENAVALIDAKNANDFAIVLNTGSPITDAVRSALYRRHIPFINSLNVKDLSQIRDYLQFLSLSMDFDTIRVKHVREIFSNYNAALNARSDEFLLSKQADENMSPKARDLKHLMEHIREHTYSDAVDILRNPGTVQIRMLLSDMGLSDSPITSEGVNRLIYAVNNVNDLYHNQEIPDNEKTGVLITDCNNSVYIDRPVVIYLGMEQDWNMTVPSKPYIDMMDQTDLNAIRMKILLQQGSKRIYMVNTTKRGERARPSTMFDVIFNEEKDSFSGICRNLVRGRWCEETESSMPDRGGSSVEPERPYDTPFSKSSFNCYWQCPRAYMFRSLMTTSDKKQTEFGNLIHAFAELYFCHRDEVRQRGVDEFVNMISDKYAGLSSPLMATLDTDRIRLAMCNVMSYIDRYAVADPPLDVENSSRQFPNRFMEKLGLPMTSSMCETEHLARTCPVHGEYDLYCSNTITDYKTGKMLGLDEISKKMVFSDKNQKPEFQPVLYLMIALLEGRGLASFNQFYVLGNDVRSATDPDFDINENVRTIRVERGSVLDYVFENEGFHEYLEEKLSKAMKPFLHKIIDAIREYGGEDYSKWDTDENLITRIMISCGKNTKTFHKDVGPAIRKITGCIRDLYILEDGVVIVPTESIERLTDVINGMHEEMKGYAVTHFPARPRIQCRNCEYYRICTEDVIEEEVEENGTE